MHRAYTVIVNIIIFGLFGGRGEEEEEEEFERTE
jgi:hypothetical protein